MSQYSGIHFENLQYCLSAQFIISKSESDALTWNVMVIIFNVTWKLSIDLSWLNCFSSFSSVLAQAPKVVKIFTNLLRSMGFDDAERSEPVQMLDLSEEDYKEDGLIPLRYVKFQNVQSVTVNTWKKKHLLLLTNSVFTYGYMSCSFFFFSTSCLSNQIKEMRRQQKSSTWHL